MKLKKTGIIVGMMVMVSAASYSQAETFVVNGIETAKFTAVVQILTQYGDCSGVRVGKGVLLTAGHCTTVSLTDRTELKPKEITIELGSERVVAKQVIRAYGLYHQASFQNESYELDYNHDLALILFSEPSKNHSVISVSQSDGQVGDEVTLVGYGENDPDALFFHGNGTKRYGSNRLTEVEDDLFFFNGTYEYKWFHAATGDNASASEGDSGGALLNQNGHLIGILTGGSSLPNHESKSRAIRLAGECGRNLFAKARELGVQIQFRR